MYQKEYILRMVEMLGELIAGILGLIKKGEFEKATQALDNVYMDLLKEDAALFRTIPKEKLTKKLISIHHYTNDHLAILAELFSVEAELLFARGKLEPSVEYYEKALFLFEFVVKESRSFSMDKQDKITKIKNQIDQIKSIGS